MIVELEGDAEILTSAEGTALVAFGLQGDVNIVVDGVGTIEGGQIDETEDLIGEAFFSVTATAILDIEVEPVDVPFVIDMEDIKIVSITMPVPTEFDQFGRPTG